MKENNLIEQVLTFAEAESLYGLSTGALRKYVSYNLKNGGRFTEGIDYRKSGKTWLITKEAMDRVYKK